MRFEERRTECATDTQHIVNLSAYCWARKNLDGVADMQVLDVACGTGYGSYDLAARARSVMGVDLDFPTIREANRCYCRPNLYFLSMDCLNLAFKHASFDAVVSFETIEHVVDARQFLREVTRVMTPDGWLILSTPMGNQPELFQRTPSIVWSTLETS